MHKATNLILTASLVVITSTFGFNVFADDMGDGSNGGASAPSGTPSNDSIYMYQAPGGKQVITPGFKYTSKTENFLGGSSAQITLPEVHLSYEFGLSDMFSAGATIGDVFNGQITVSNAPNTTISGLENVDVFAKGKWDLGAGSIKYGADFSWSTGNAQISATTGQMTSPQTGGNTVTPYLGYQIGLTTGLIGAKVSTQIELGSRTYNLGGLFNTTVSGGDMTEVDVFYEVHAAPGYTFGGAVFDQMFSSVKSPAGISLHSATPFYGVEVYGDLNVGVGEVLPMITYASCSDNTDSSALSQYPFGEQFPITSDSFWVAQVDYRWTF